MTDCMFHSGDDCPAARELADLDRQIDLRMKAEAENNRLREALEAGAVVHMSKSHLAYLIAEARAEALKEAANIAENILKNCPRDKYEGYMILPGIFRAAITQEPQK